ncbi:hypothetical protein [Leuconostoc rapi]|uniref:hypothetical protein n=1 Tax=Leuconostoc rapi TaxID=1406906 RepID=UPI0019563E4E|nr:hypothetical protein [Leuconostoc rapi]MBM7435196.1 hypothetical protein [Leuconostoc rapi]
MLLFKRTKKNNESKLDEDTVSRAIFDTMQQENDQLLDDLETLKLDVSELTEKNRHLTEQLTRSKYYQSLVKTSMGLGVLIASFAVLHLLDEAPEYTAILLLIEAAFIFMMLRSSDK